MSYIINKWALVRRGELSVMPDEMQIHPDFLHDISRDKFEVAFRQIGGIFRRIMTDISENPERFSMPLCGEDTRYGAAEAQESRYAAWRPMKLLYAVFTNGELNNNVFYVDVPAFKQANKVKNLPVLLHALRGCGFIFSGLKNDKITAKTTGFTVEYPDNPDIITVMSLVARKAASVNAEDMFHRWSFRLPSEGFGMNSYNDSLYAVLDKTRADGEREFIRSFHEVMLDKGYFHANGGWNEGPGICYYDWEAVMKRKGPYLFRILDWMGELRLMLRIRDAERCVDLYDDAEMPFEIAEMFRHSDPGCGANASGSCKKGVKYIFEAQPRWHCGCCSAPFWLRPKEENIPQYIMLVEIGEKRCAR